MRLRPTSPPRRNRWVVLVLAVQLGLLLWCLTPSCGSSTPRRNPRRGNTAAKTCVDCHQDFLDQLSGTRHLDDLEASCEECHDRHGLVGVLKLKVEEPALCLQCHDDAQAFLDTAHPHTPLVDGKCSSCHDPHASKETKLLKAKGAALCFTCHATETFRRKTVHDPAEDDCMDCHDPHGGAELNGTLLPVPALCMECHDGEDEDFIGSHKDYDVSRSDCGACHNPHSSDNSGMMRAAVHGPVGSGDCDVCHVEPSEVGADDDFPALLLSPTKLCVDCHEDDADDFKARESQHDPVASGDCMECHAPHASENRMMVVAPPDRRLCQNCHEDTTEQIDQFTVFRGSLHKPASEGNCLGCHDPHGGKDFSLLKLPEQKLCVSCHDEVAEDFEKANVHDALETCTACHAAHGSQSKPILKAAPMDLCVDCHDDFADRFKNETLHEPVATGQCVVCHDPHASEHEKFLHVEQANLCQQCHTKITAQVVGGSTHTPVGKGECFECHDAHGSLNQDLLLATGGELCGKCHGMTQNAIAEAAVRHAPAEAGACLACHGPHTAPREHLLSLPTQDLCRTCHGIILEEMTWPGYESHPPAAEGKCLDCHMPHASANAGLAIMATPDLCWSCHEANTPAMKEKHLGLLTKTIDCLTCHAPHSAEGAGLFWPNRHPPFAEKSCDECHLDQNK